jgi:hypothetical protein
MTHGAEQADASGGVNHGERHEDKPTIPADAQGVRQAEPDSPAPIEQPSRSVLYRERLKLIWAAAHSQVEADDKEWWAFQEAMVRVGDVVALVGDEDVREADTRGPWKGSASGTGP